MGLECGVDAMATIPSVVVIRGPKSPAVNAVTSIQLEHEGDLAAKAAIASYFSAFPANATRANRIDWASIFALLEDLRTEGEEAPGRQVVERAVATGINGRWPALSQAVVEGDLGIVNRLLELGVDPNACSQQHREQYRAPLAACAFLSTDLSVQLAEALLTKGKARPTNYTIMAACQAGNLGFFKMLISAPGDMRRSLPLDPEMERLVLVLLAEGRPGFVQEKGNEEDRKKIATILLNGRASFELPPTICNTNGSSTIGNCEVDETLPSDLADENGRCALASFLRSCSV